MNLEILDKELLELIFQFCFDDSIVLRQVCRRWKELIPYDQVHLDRYLKVCFREGRVETVKKFPRTVFNKQLVLRETVRGGSIKILELYPKFSNFRKNQILEDACYYGKIPVLEWMIQTYGCRLNKRLCFIAAKENKLETLKWLRANGCKWDEKTCSIALQKLHFEVLLWAIENGCPRTKECSSAIKVYLENSAFSNYG